MARALLISFELDELRRLMLLRLRRPTAMTVSKIINESVMISAKPLFDPDLSERPEKRKGSLVLRSLPHGIFVFDSKSDKRMGS